MYVQLSGKILFGKHSTNLTTAERQIQRFQGYKQ